MQEKKSGKITKVSGPLVVARDLENITMNEVVRVGDQKLIGEVIKIVGEDIYIQVYEETSGIGPGDPVAATGGPLSVELGPGLMTTIYDGIERPLKVIAEKSGGGFIARGVTADALDRAKKWQFKATKKVGDRAEAGDVVGEVKETPLVTHKIMVPPGISGEVIKLNDAELTVDEFAAELKTAAGETVKVPMKQTWPIRNRRPIKNKMMPQVPLESGQRIIDTLFPVVKGGTASVPGPFGAGKTVVQHQLAKWADADIVVFVGCGERGNEMTDVLLEFPELEDPKTGRPLMERTILIANTSNMPVAAREASVYTGMTIAEYFRDMGYDVALMADSTSRWAEALREISGRLEEMPGEEGYPAYLGSRTAAFYERAGAVKCLGSEERVGSLTAIGAVSPPGGDLSEPVTQNTLRVTKVFWGLDYALAYKRHFPAINWLNSYSLYHDNLKKYYEEKVDKEFPGIQKRVLELLQKEAQLEEVVRLVGIEALSAEEQLILDTTKTIREDFLHQNAFDKDDSYTPLSKQYWLLKLILAFHDKGVKLLGEGKELKDVVGSELKTKVANANREIKADEETGFKELLAEVERF